VGITLGFTAFRGTAGLVWDDSSGTSMADNNEPAHFDARVAARRAAFGRDPLGALGQSALEVFSSCADNGFRPISTLYFQLCYGYLYDHHQHTVGHLLLVGCFYGAFAVCFLLVARRFVRHEITAWFALLLTLASPPAAATSWVFMSFLQIIMPLIICAALLAYWHWRERNSALALSCLCLLWLLGPWCREILFVVPLLIGYLELEAEKRPTWILALAVLAFLHALYPTALLKLLLFPTLPLQSMFQMGGHVTRQLSGEPLRWQAGWHFVPLLPPSLWLLGLGAALLVIPRGDHVQSWFGALRRWSRFLLMPGVLALAVLLACYGSPCAGVILCLLVPALAWRQDAPFLAVWFLILFLPMLRVFTEHIHFLYALLPAALILARASESLWLTFAEQRRGEIWLRRAVLTVALVAAADQALVLYGTYRTMHATYDGIDAVASQLRPLVRRHDTVVSNVLHSEEIWYRAGYGYRNFMAILWGIPDQNRCVAASADFLALLRDPQRGDIYLLDVDFDYLHSKRGHRHKYVHSFDMAKDDLGRLHETRLYYPYCDPLRPLIPREYVPFLGAPDLVNDFYCGPAQNGRWFCYEIHAVYHLHRVTGRAMTPLRDGPVSLEEEGVQGFNILRVGEGYLAFPQAYGIFDLAKYHRGDYDPLITGLTVEEVRHKLLHDTPAGQP
jgi:hypothetical protein